MANGNRYLISPQAYYYVGPFGLLGEYVQTAQDVKNGNTFGEISTSAWQVAASYVITGEKASYKSVTPRKSSILGREVLAPLNWPAVIPN